jgi:hypothetical protein
MFPMRSWGAFPLNNAEIGALNANPVRWEATALPLSYTRAR